jgi:ATP-dependent DNA helicase RecG
LKRDQGLSVKELATLLNKTTRTIERRIKELREQGLLKRVGSDKAGHWEVVGK